MPAAILRNQEVSFLKTVMNSYDNDYMYFCIHEKAYGNKRCNYAF